MFHNSIVALITPFQQGGVDRSALKSLVQWHKQKGTSAILACGTTGESLLLTPQERHSILETCVMEAEGLPVIAGCGTASTEETICLVHEAQVIGAKAALIVSPYYIKPTQKGLYNHFKGIHDHTHLPLILYNNPGRSAVDLDVDTIGELAQLPRICGLKDSNADLRRIGLIRNKLNQNGVSDFSLLSGDDVTSSAYMLHGGDGVISVTANVAPEQCAELCQLLKQSNLQKFQKAANQLMILHTVLSFDGNPMAIKYAVSALGMCQNELRLPLCSISKDREVMIRGVMHHLGLMQEAIVEEKYIA